MTDYPKIIQTSRLRLKPHVKEDKEGIIKIGFDPDLFRGIGSPMPDLTIQEYADQWLHLKQDPKYSWAIEANETCVGSVWIHSIEKVNRRARFAIEIHDPNFRNQGFGKEATKAVIKFAFGFLKLHRLDLRVLTSNRHAIECYKSCGFVEEGIQRETLYLDGEWDSDLWMSILESEYNKVQQTGVSNVANTPSSSSMRNSEKEMITKGINFLKELEKLKAVDRRSYPIGLNRKENSAEHSWSLAMAVMTIAPLVDAGLDTFRAIQMALIHDVVEIDAGDTFCYADQSGKYEREVSAAKRIFEMLPSPQAQTYFELWQEFESRSTKEALFVNAFDRILPLIQNHEGEGRSWIENQVYYEQVFERNRTIKDGSEELWAYALQIMDAARKSGWLPSKAKSEPVE